MTVLRTWAFWDGLEDGALQRAPGVFDERSFCALDFVLHEASLRNIKLLLVLTNYWKEFGGMQQYLKYLSTHFYIFTLRLAQMVQR